jgi:CheY-like chemotaxis protein
VTVTVANNGEEAVELSKSHSFDLILMDMQMPVMDGIEATREIRAAGNTIPIIALTANVMQAHRDAFNAAGCDDFLGKPINRQKLLQLLKGYISEG